MIPHSEVEHIIKYNNKNVSRHERSAKFVILRALGFSVDNSRRMRDWTMSHIALASRRLHEKIYCHRKIESEGFKT